MKETLQTTPDDLTLDQIMQRFSSDEDARAYWESIHWPNGAVCPHCKNNEAKSIWKIEANAKKKIRAGLHQCGKCDKQFTSTIRTIFEDSHIPLRLPSPKTPPLPPHPPTRRPPLHLQKPTQKNPSLTHTP